MKPLALQMSSLINSKTGEWLLKDLFWRVIDPLYFILAAISLPNIATRFSAEKYIVSTFIIYGCCVALCYLGTRKSENITQKQFVLYSLCVLIPLALTMLIDKNTSVIDFFINSFCALFSMFLGYRKNRHPKNDK